MIAQACASLRVVRIAATDAPPVAATDAAQTALMYVLRLIRLLYPVLAVIAKVLVLDIALLKLQLSGNKQ